MKRVTLFLGDQQHAQLVTVAERIGRPYSELVRDAVDRWLREQEAPRKPERKRAATRRRS